MAPSGRPGPSTRCVHAGERPDAASGALNTPIHPSTTYLFPEGAGGEPATHIYSRYDNPTLQAVEAKLAALEDADGAYLFASGMGAIQATCNALLPGPDAGRRGSIVHLAGIYGGTTALFHEELAPRGVTVAAASPDDEPEIPDGTDIVWIESITNPLLRVPDVSDWADAAHDAGARLVVDATFATPLLQRPLALGADVVVHSATKYLNGHGDVTAGVVAADEELLPALWQRRRNLGATLDPHAAYQVGRGMKTLDLRLRRQSENALALAQAMADDPRVMAAHHPGLPDHPDHAIAARVLDGYGAMLSLDLGSLAAAQAFRRAVQWFAPAASLGGVESLVSLPLETSHAYASPDERRAAGVTDGLVRLSVGIEDLDDLQEDLERGLAAAALAAPSSAEAA
ncbi:MAG: trans-sulfuration enzyme family protein [Thermoplasmatota archaeon]